MSVCRLMSALSVLSLIFISACAHTPHQNILQNMLIAGSAGIVLGQQKEDFKSTHSTMYGSLAAAVTGAMSVYLNSLNDDEIQMENQQLKIKIETFQKQLQPQLVQQGSSLFSSPLPKEVAGLVEPGEWKRYKLDQWVQDPNQSNTWYRQVEMFEIIPPISK